MHDIIDSKSLAILHLSLQWESGFANHTETLYLPLNVWRELDLWPPVLRDALMGQPAGAVIKKAFPAGSLAPAYNEALVKWFAPESFAQGQRRPGLGRYYPGGLLLGYSQVLTPFRCSAINGGAFSADFNHPLAGPPLELEIAVSEVRKKRGDTGGICHDWLQIMADGPGMQVRHARRPTDFFSGDPFARSDGREDACFYEKARLVNHIDEQADETIRNLYGRLLKPGSRVLDLMSSWNSHLPETLELGKLTGLGLNREEMAQNPRLNDYVVHDLNRQPFLPFGEQEFQAVICTVSVEYLIHPLKIFQEAVRVLKPGGIFIHTFSNRWFPPKVVRIWTELLEWERPGLVMEYFLLSRAFDRLHTFSARGWPRPATDRYFPHAPLSDPVYAVWGHKRG